MLRIGVNKRNWLSKSFFSHYVVKILSGNFSAIRRSALKHFLQLACVHSFTKFLGYSPDIVDIDEACPVIVKEVKNFIDSVLNKWRFTRVYLSPSLAVIPSRNSSKSIYLPSASRSAIILKMVGFLVSKPSDCIADLSSLGSILPVASVSKRLKASLNY